MMVKKEFLLRTSFDQSILMLILIKVKLRSFQSQSLFSFFQLLEYVSLLEHTVDTYDNSMVVQSNHQDNRRSFPKHP